MTYDSCIRDLRFLDIAISILHIITGFIVPFTAESASLTDQASVGDEGVGVDLVPGELNKGVRSRGDYPQVVVTWGLPVIKFVNYIFLTSTFENLLCSTSMV